MKSKYLQRKINDGLGGETCVRGEGMGAEEKEKKINYSWYSVQGPGRMDGSNASGWYRRLCEPISLLSLLNCDQL